jgi:hypothetical protein
MIACSSLSNLCTFDHDAGTAVVSLVSWRREARTLDRARRVEMSYTGHEAAILAEEAVAEGLDARNRPALVARFADVQLRVLSDFEEVLAVEHFCSDRLAMVSRPISGIL